MKVLSEFFAQVFNTIIFIEGLFIGW
jgi:hypothetical protein